ncbi:hypothetical protein [Pampinifervens florentissimum]|uniref:hypothetical protein n=1 Tax=Pampinifervens florentissimum TaxID=1632019 RepID=UPI0013B48938|nr:hypothetical protein [Hydrogenobacter sp. T-8]QID32904.1 hypothetical protein G3M65_03570 [Hydrogenobacter sp. T-8]
MQSRKLFEGNYMQGKVGLFPFTPENLMRVGLALCTYLKINKSIERPKMRVDALNFLTLSVAVGFMTGGGDVYMDEEGDIILRYVMEEGNARLWIENLQDYELKMVESILFSRYNMPRSEGEEVGSIWIPRNSL